MRRTARIASPLLLLLCVGVAEANHIVQLHLPTRDLVYDRHRGRIYASVPGSAGRIGNRIAWIDPRRGRIGGYLPVGAEPSRLALSDDGRYLYVALEERGAIRRLDLRSPARTIEFSLGKDALGGPYVIHDMEVAPGQPRTLAVSRMSRELTWSDTALVVYDDGIPRPRLSQTAAPDFSIAFGASASQLYAANADGFRRVTLEPEGPRLLDLTRGVNLGPEIAYAVGHVYGTNGAVLDPQTLQLAGSFGGLTYPAYVAPDPAIHRAFFLTWGPLPVSAYDTRTFVSVGRLRLPPLSRPPSRLIRWGEDGLAFRTDGEEVVLMRTSLVEPSPPAADLTVSMRATPEFVWLGGRLTYDIRVTNRGPDPATGVTVTAGYPPELRVLSVSSGSRGVKIAERETAIDLGNLAAGSTARITIRATPLAPSTVGLGVDALGGEVDPNTENNQALIGTTVYLTSRRDLSGFWEDVLLSCPVSRRAPRTCSVQGRFYTHNQSGETTAACVVRLYLSQDGELDAGDRLLKQVTTPLLARGQTHAIDVRASARPPAGTTGLWLIAVVDATDIVSEVNERNNIVRLGLIFAP